MFLPFLTFRMMIMMQGFSIDGSRRFRLCELCRRPGPWLADTLGVAGDALVRAMQCHTADAEADIADAASKFALRPGEGRGCHCVPPERASRDRKASATPGSPEHRARFGIGSMQPADTAPLSVGRFREHFGENGQEERHLS